MREIVLDTETTGLSPGEGHRVCEVACVELFNHVPTGRIFHRYVNPGRAMPEGARAVHGLTDEFLAQHPPFEAIAEELMLFLSEGRLVAHNAEFDIAFLNAEFALLGRPQLTHEFEDTLALARKRYPGASNNLDALCKRFNIDTTAREKHGALIDCHLLASVYLELVGGRQPGLDLAASLYGNGGPDRVRPARPPRPHAASPEEYALHVAFLTKIKTPIWSQ